MIFQWEAVSNVFTVGAVTVGWSGYVGVVLVGIVGAVSGCMVQVHDSDPYVKSAATLIQQTQTSHCSAVS